MLPKFYITGIFFTNTDYDSAIDAIAKEEVAIQNLGESLTKYETLSKMFMLEGGLTKLQDILHKMEREIVTMQGHWELSKEYGLFFKQCQSKKWSETDPNTMEETAKAYFKKIRGQDKTIKWCEAFKALEKTVKQFMQTCPLILALQSDAMHPRHWAALQEITKKAKTFKAFTYPFEDPSVLLGDLLALQLHQCMNDVEDLTDQASKEAKMELTLANLEKTWSAVVWVMETYKSTSVQMVRMAEEDFEVLEADQLAVQGMMGSRFLATFEDEVTGWQKKLGNTSEVFTMIQEVQRAWMYLEPLFMHSEEVKKELPEATAQFVNTDKMVKGVLGKFLNGYALMMHFTVGAHLSSVSATINTQSTWLRRKTLLSLAISTPTTRPAA